MEHYIPRSLAITTLKPHKAPDQAPYFLKSPKASKEDQMLETPTFPKIRNPLYRIRCWRHDPIRLLPPGVGDVHVEGAARGAAGSLEALGNVGALIN